MLIFFVKSKGCYKSIEVGFYNLSILKLKFELTDRWDGYKIKHKLQFVRVMITIFLSLKNVAS